MFVRVRAARRARSGLRGYGRSVSKRACQARPSPYLDISSDALIAGISGAAAEVCALTVPLLAVLQACDVGADRAQTISQPDIREGCWYPGQIFGMSMDILSSLMERGDARPCLMCVHGAVYQRALLVDCSNRCFEDDIKSSSYYNGHRYDFARPISEVRRPCATSRTPLSGTTGNRHSTAPLVQADKRMAASPRSKQ